MFNIAKMTLLIMQPILSTSVTHVPVFLITAPRVLRSLRFARFLSTGGDKLKMITLDFDYAYA